MSNLFETLTAEEYNEAGTGVRKGQYRDLLEQFISSGAQYARISTKADSGSWAAGKKSSSISTSLKGARDAKGAPSGFTQVKVSSRDGIVYLENTAVEA